jgi:hypothetical protein
LPTLKLKTLYRLFIFLPLLTLTSCFDVIEDVTLSEDGSGSFAFTVNMSQSSAKLAAALLVDSINGHKVPSKEEINNRIKEVVTIAEKTQGIKDVKTQQDFTNFVFSFRCSFTDLNALNTLMEELKKKYQAEHYVGSVTKHFEYDKKAKIYMRNGNYSIGEAYGQLRNVDKNVLNKASFVSISRFNSEVAHVTNVKATIAPTKKAVMLRVNAADLIKGTQNITNKIILTK